MTISMDCTADISIDVFDCSSEAENRDVEGAPPRLGGVASEYRRDEIVARFLAPEGPQMLVITKDLDMARPWDSRYDGPPQPVSRKNAGGVG